MQPMKLTRYLSLICFLAVFFTSRTASAQFNRYYLPDRDSVNTYDFLAAASDGEGHILALTYAYEYHSGVGFHPWQLYVERFDLAGNKLNKISINEQFSVDSTYYLSVDYAIIKDEQGGFRFMAYKYNTDESYFYTIWVSDNLDSISVHEITGMPASYLTDCPSTEGELRDDPNGGYFFTVDYPSNCEDIKPGKNRIFHLNEQGDLDWYRTTFDTYPYSETIMDVVRHPQTGDIYYCGNYALTGYLCAYPEFRYCSNKAFVYKCDSLGLNCTRIYFRQDSVDAYQECNFIQVLKNGNLGLYHPIIETHKYWTESLGSARVRELDLNGNVVKDYLDLYYSSTHKFNAFFEGEGDTKWMIYTETWAIPGNEVNGNQIYIPTVRINTYQDTSILYEQGVYEPTQISINSKYTINNAIMFDSMILMVGNLLVESESRFLPYMVLTDTDKCLPGVPCVSVGIDEVTSTSFNGDLVVYPNPASDDITISLSESNTVILTDMSGHHLKRWQGEIGDNTFQIEDVPAGVYILTAGKSFAKIIVE